MWTCASSSTTFTMALWEDRPFLSTSWERFEREMSSFLPDVFGLTSRGICIRVRSEKIEGCFFSKLSKTWTLSVSGQRLVHHSYPMTTCVVTGQRTTYIECWPLLNVLNEMVVKVFIDVRSQFYVSEWIRNGWIYTLRKATSRVSRESSKVSTA